MTDAERNLLGLVKYTPSVLDRGMIREADVVSADARALLKAMLRMYAAGIPITDETLQHESKVPLERVVELQWCSEANLDYYVREAREQARRTYMRQIGLKLLDAHKMREESSVMIAMLEKSLTQMVLSGVQSQGPVQDFMVSYSRGVQERWRTGLVQGVPSGFPSLDNMTSGFLPGEMTVIAARPSVGKTAMALSMIAEIARHYAVGLFSLEMNRDQIIGRLVAIMSMTPLMIALGRRRMRETAKTVEEALRGMELVHGLKLFLNFTPAIRLEECLASARGMVRQGAEILFVDYLTLIYYENRQMSRPERVGQVSKSLKWLAREMDVPVVVMSQLNREGERSKPSMSQLRQCVAPGTVIRGQYGNVETIQEMASREKPSRIRTVDQDGKIRSRLPVAVFPTGKKKCYRVTLESGKSIIISEDSRLLRKDAWTKVSELSVGEKVTVYAAPWANVKGQATNTGRTRFRKGNVPWNKGKTKETDARIKAKDGFRKGVSIPKPEGFSETMKKVRPAQKEKYDQKGYKKLYMPDYQWGGKSRGDRGFIYEHQYIMEQYIGRRLRRGEQIHHIDGDKRNNKIENLLLCETAKEHMRVHALEQHFVERLIREGKVIFDAEAMEFKLTGTEGREDRGDRGRRDDGNV